MTTTTTAPTSASNGATKPPSAMTDQVRLTEWVDRARRAGHPVQDARVGRLRPRPIPVALPGTTPNDRLAIAREHARAQVAWVRVLMPTSNDLLALGEALRPSPAPARRPGLLSRLGRRGQPRTTAQGGAGGGVGPVAVSDTVDDVTVHVLEIPVSWLARPVTVIRRPTRPVDDGADAAQVGARTVVTR
jgi:hypothetical protein